jgi:hypothetical protein
MAYSIKRWQGLSLYATTGHLHIDNNPLEASMSAKRRFILLGPKKLHQLESWCNIEILTIEAWIQHRRQPLLVIKGFDFLFNY